MKRLIGKFFGKDGDAGDSGTPHSPHDITRPTPRVSELELVPNEPPLILKDVYEDKHRQHKVTIEVRSDGIRIDDEGNITNVDLNETSEYHQIELGMRSHIAKKIAMLAPLLMQEDKQYLLHYTIQVLKTLVNDQEDRVRRIIAEELKDKSAAPEEIIHELAWDVEPNVAVPVLEYSPLLSDDALVEILQTSDLPWLSESIAKRDALSARVSDEIIATDNNQAIYELLSNPGASISPDGLEQIIRKAPEVDYWHEPLAYRPELTQNTVNRIASFISLTLFRKLESEKRLPPDTLTHLRLAVNQRIQNLSLDRERSAEITTRDLFYHGRLDAARVLQSVEKNEEAFVAHALALLSRFSVEKTRRILTSGNPKAVVALAWQSGLSMRDAIPLQLKIAKIQHTNAIYAKDGIEYPLSEEKMTEYLDFFA